MKFKNNILIIISVVIIIGIITSLIIINPKEPETIKLGVLTPLSGDGVIYGENTRNSIEMAVKEINDNGGINGKLLETIMKMENVQVKMQ
jgi:ABC-type branched-subunit amino acid transport system substrate-binding protein